MDKNINSTSKENKKLTYDYIRGFVEVGGSFTFTTTKYNRRSGESVRRKIPTFSIGMHEKEEDLLNRVRNTLGLKNKVYNYRLSERDGIKRGRRVILIVREIGSLKNIVIPFFYNRLVGYKGVQFIDWLDKIGNDPDISESYRILYQLHASGFYKNNPKFTE